jgi:hypothetical protein
VTIRPTSIHHIRQVLLHLRVRSWLTRSFQKPVHSVFVSSSDASVQDEQWVALTRNLTLLPAQCHTEHETTWSNNGVNTMVRIFFPIRLARLLSHFHTFVLCYPQNLDEPLRLSNRLYSHATPRFQHEQSKIHITDNNTAAPILVHPNPCPPMSNVFSSQLTLPPATATGYLQTSDHVAIPTPPISTVMLPSHSPFSGGCGDTTPPDSHPSQQQQMPPRRSRFTMGPRPDCEKCRLGVPGHYAHFD